MFSGPVIAEWLDDGRDMRLVQELKFTDTTSRVWVAPAGSRINGASIPRIFWPIVGSPYVGKYRRASVIHDVECALKFSDWEDVHRVFNEMMKFDRVDNHLRQRIFKAVWYFGPRWGATHLFDQHGVLSAPSPFELPSGVKDLMGLLDSRPWPLEDMT